MYNRMESLIIQNLLEQVKKLTEENKILIEENKRLKLKGDAEDSDDADSDDSKDGDSDNDDEIIQDSQLCMKNNISLEERFINKTYLTSMNNNEFEVFIKQSITEADLFNCIDKPIFDVIIDILNRELSNKDIRPFHAIKYNKNVYYYLVKIDDKWIKKEYYDFNLFFKRLNNIISHTMSIILYKLKKSKKYKNGGSGTHKYGDYQFDYDCLISNLMTEIKHTSISKKLTRMLQIKL